MDSIKPIKNIIILSIVAISILQYLWFLGLGLNSSGVHDDFFMFLRSSQYLRNYDKAIDTELPRKNLPEQLNNNEWFNKRFDISESHWKTYTLSSLLYNIPVLFTDLIKKHNSKVIYSSRLLAMLISSFLFVFLIFIWIVNRFLDKQMVLYVLTTFFISMMIFFIVNKYNIAYQYDAHLFGKFKDLKDFVISIPALLFRPTYEYHFLGFTPRNHFTLMLFTTFLLRWSGYYKLSYWSLFIGFLYHAGMGIIFFGFIIIFDLIRKIYFNHSNFNFAVIFLLPLLFIVRSDLLFILLSNYSLSIIHLLLLISILIVAVYTFQYLIKNISFKNPLPDYILSKLYNPIICDIILFFCVWIAALPFVIYLNSIADDFSSRYLWSQILGRPLAMMHGPILLAFVICIYKWIERSRIKSKYYYTIIFRKMLPIGLYLFIIICFSTSIYAFNKGYSTFSALTNEFEERLDKPFIPFASNSKNEAFLLYILIRSFDDKKYYFSKSLQLLNDDQ